MLTPSNNLISFLPTGGSAHITLTLSGDWTISGGLDCNVNTAEIPWTERSKLPTNLVYVNGSIYLWGSVPFGGGEPEHVLGNQWLVDCTVSRVGFLPGDSAERVLAYTLSFADHRHAFRVPRGGRLSQGLGNPEPIGDATLVNNDDLIDACLTAMGVSASVPGSINDVEPMRQLEWYGVHAPTELGRLLQHTGHVYCPYSAGGGTLQRLGVGEMPTIPAGRLSSDITASSVNRLPTTAIITSCPAASARTYDHDASASVAPSWEFVAQDPANDYKWNPLASIAALGTDPAKAMARGLPDVDEKDRKLLAEQLFKVIRLKNDRYDPLQCPVLRDVLYPDGRVDQPHLVATVAVQGVDNAWVNQETRLNASTVDGVGNLLAFDTRLGKVKGGTERADLDAFFEPLAASALKPTFTVEDYDGSNKVYGVFGYTIGLGVAAMSESAARDKLTGYRPETAVFDVPELRTIYLNDDTNNRDTLATRAQGQAEALLQGGSNARNVVVSGYLPVQVDGRINEVRYNQQRYSTTFIRDGWTAASLGRHARYSDHATGGGGHDHGGGVGVNDDPTRYVRPRDRRRPHARSRRLSRSPAAARSPVSVRRWRRRPVTRSRGCAESPSFRSRR